MKKTILLLSIFTVIPLSAKDAESSKLLTSNQVTDANEVKATREKSKIDVIIDISASGELSVGEDKLTKKSLKKKLGRVIAVKKNLKLLIRASAKVEQKKVIEILDICKDLGILNVSLATLKK